MKDALRFAIALVVLSALVHTGAAFGVTLQATNVAGSDGSPSRINAGTPPKPLVISNVVGLALTNPDYPGDNSIFAGSNSTPDVRVSDTYFQSGAVAGPVDPAGEGSPPASAVDSMLLMEATDSGLIGTDNVIWSVTAYNHYAGKGVLNPIFSQVTQTSSSFYAEGIRLTVTGNIVAGDKFVVHNSGVTSGDLGAYVDIDGDSVFTRMMNITAEGFTGLSVLQSPSISYFNGQTVTFVGWEIKDGQFAKGQFDVTLDEVSLAHTWPRGDGFDVVPEPASLSLLALGGLALVRRKRR